MSFQNNYLNMPSYGVPLAQLNQQLDPFAGYLLPSCSSEPHVIGNQPGTSFNREAPGKMFETSSNLPYFNNSYSYNLGGVQNNHTLVNNSYYHQQQFYKPTDVWNGDFQNYNKPPPQKILEDQMYNKEKYLETDCKPKNESSLLGDYQSPSTTDCKPRNEFSLLGDYQSPSTTDCKPRNESSLLGDYQSPSTSKGANKNSIAFYLDKFAYSSYQNIFQLQNENVRRYVGQNLYMQNPQKSLVDSKKIHVQKTPITEVEECNDEDWEEEDKLWSDSEDSQYDEEEVGLEKSIATTQSSPFTFHFKYTVYPPSAEIMGEIFKGFVIYYYYKFKNVPQKNPFYVIYKSFARSDEFNFLRVKAGTKFVVGFKIQRFCTLTWKGMMLVKAAGDSSEEALVRAGAELINKLAMTCYTLQMKDEYFSLSAFEEILRQKELRGVFRVVSRQAVTTVNSIFRYIDKFFKFDSDCELIFGGEGFTKTDLFAIKCYATRNQYDIRSINDYVSVFIKRTPQYWRDTILASGQMENEKFKLFPPQGLGNEILSDFDFSTILPKLNSKSLVKGPTNSLSYLYGPVAPLIEIRDETLAPWDLLNQPTSSLKQQQRKKWRQKLKYIEVSLRKRKPIDPIKELKNVPRWVRERFITKMVKKKLL